MKGFELKCVDNEYATITVNDGAPFRVLDINNSTKQIRIARVDIDGGVNNCFPRGSYNFPNKTIFGYDYDTEIIYLYYGCKSVVDVESVWNKFTCTKDGGQTNGYYASQSSVSPDELIELTGCTTQMVVPVLRKGLEKLRSNVSMTMAELLVEGFVLDYIIDEVACSACVNSSGLCGSDGADPSKFWCICRDGAYPYSCPRRGVSFYIFLFVVY